MTRPPIVFAEDALPSLVDGANSPTSGRVLELLGWLEVFRELNKSAVLTWKGANNATIDVGASSNEKFAPRCRQFVTDYHLPQILAEHFLNQHESTVKL